MTVTEKVSLAGCGSYSEELVYEAVKKAVEGIGGISEYIEKGMIVALKPNLLLPIRPEACATTHPAVVGAVGRLVIEAGGKPIIVESPGGLYNKAVLRTVYRVCGISDVCERYGIDLNYDTSLSKVQGTVYGRNRSFTILKPLADADFIINIPKLKTHGMMVLTGAVKNMFGSIAGTEKATHHMNVPDYNAFASNMIDICGMAAPGLTVMDAIIGMEGNGPSAGSPREIGLVMASASPFALDRAAHDIIGLSPDESYIMSEAIRRGIPLDYETVGESIEGYSIDDFDIPFRKGSGKLRKSLLNGRLATSFKARPVVDKDICIGCRICSNNCPAEVIEMREKKPYFDFSGCIRCFCCQELCPEHAISIKEPWLIKLLKAGRR